ncbi:hypothetical protein ALC60_09112 [Trachymyrmex zeteki]|uniref:Uncharacterized protein n=1 Tax=Mycetomoellerius zeteki TaxID=64791 RepID=A0A151WVR7_9HYME|nr:hypothetical protein ALC60_09112 [Trachymyrmex zeteki]
MLGGGGGGGATSTRRRTFHGSQRITRNLDESLASCDELEGSDATMSIAQGQALAALFVYAGQTSRACDRRALIRRHSWKTSSSDDYNEVLWCIGTVLIPRTGGCRGATAPTA